MIIAETQRLVLRQFHIADALAMERVLCDAEVMQYSAGIKAPAEVPKWLAGCLEDYHRKWGFGLWAVVDKSQREVIGYCGLSYFPDVGGQAEVEVGYRVARAYWGKGLATEAALAVRDYAFTTLCLRRLVAMIDPRNVASIRVAEKLGMRFEKQVLFQGFLDHLYVIAS